MTAHFVEVIDGKHYVYTVGRGMRRLSVGPGWGSPREAIRYAERLDTPYVSPLRESGKGSPPSSPLPLGGGDVEPLPDAPRGRRPRRRAR